MLVRTVSCVNDLRYSLSVMCASWQQQNKHCQGQQHLLQNDTCSHIGIEYKGCHYVYSYGVCCCCVSIPSYRARIVDVGSRDSS